MAGFGVNAWKKLPFGIGISPVLGGGAGDPYAGSPMVFDFATSSYRAGNSFSRNLLALSEVAFTRTGTGEAVGGGGRETFAENVPRIYRNQLHIDAGGTNLNYSSENFGHANWTKTNFGTPASIDGPFGVGEAWDIRETTANATHDLIRVQTVPSGDTFTDVWIVKPNGRDYIQLMAYNSDLSGVVQTRFLLTGNGSRTLLTASGANTPTELDGGITPFGDGYYLIWCKCKFTANTTTVRSYLRGMSDSTTTTYTGDTAKGYIVQANWLLAAIVPVSYIASGDAATGSRGAESLTVDLTSGYYSFAITDENGNEYRTAASAGADKAIAPRSGSSRLNVVEAIKHDFYDLFDRANTSAGNLGTTTSGQAWDLRGAYAAGVQPASSYGQITSNAFVVPEGEIVYGFFDCDAVPGHFETEFSWVDDGVGTEFTTLAFALSTDDEVRVLNMLHITLTNSSIFIQKRVAPGGFVTLNTGNTTISPSLALANTHHILRVDITPDHQTVRVRVDSAVDITVSDSDLALVIGRFGFVEHYSANTSVRYPLSIYKVASSPLRQLTG